MKATKRLKRQFYIEFLCYLVFAPGLIISLILLVIYRKNFPIEAMPFLLIAIISITEAGFLYMLIKFFKDLKSVRNNSFEEITGIVIGYKTNYDVDTGMQVHNRPIVRAIGSNDEVTLRVSDGTTTRNETYTFVYLKYTKIAVVETNK